MKFRKLTRCRFARLIFTRALSIIVTFPRNSPLELGVRAHRVLRVCDDKYFLCARNCFYGDISFPLETHDNLLITEQFFSISFPFVSAHVKNHRLTVFVSPLLLAFHYRVNKSTRDSDSFVFYCSVYRLFKKMHSRFSLSRFIAVIDRGAWCRE